MGCLELALLYHHRILLEGVDVILQLFLNLGELGHAELLKSPQENLKVIVQQLLVQYLPNVLLLGNLNLAYNILNLLQDPLEKVLEVNFQELDIIVKKSVYNFADLAADGLEAAVLDGVELLNELLLIKNLENLGLQIGEHLDQLLLELV